MTDFIIKHHFEADTSMGKESTLSIMGLVDKDLFEEEPDKPDTQMYLLGMTSYMETKDEILMEIYDRLYDITQTRDNGVINDQDTFTIEPCIWRSGTRKGVRLPKQTFRMESYHLVAEHLP